MTIADLKLRIAEEVAIHAHDPSTGNRIAPETIADADRIERALRDGYAEFCDVRPWVFMRTVVELGIGPGGGIGGDPCRYPTPSGMSMNVMDTKVLFATENGGGCDADVVDPMTVRRHQITRPNESGAPAYMAIGKSVRLGASPSMVTDHEGRGGLEVLIWPKPDQVYTGLFETHLRPPLPVDPNACGPWFAVHDLTIVAFAARSFLRVGSAANAPAIAGIQARVGERLTVSMRADDKLAEVHKPMPGTRMRGTGRLSANSQVIIGG